MSLLSLLSLLSLPPLKHPFSSIHWAAVLAGLTCGTLRAQWPATMDAQLRQAGEACLDYDPEKRPTAEVLSKAGVPGSQSRCPPLLHFTRGPLSCFGCWSYMRRKCVSPMNVAGGSIAQITQNAPQVMIAVEDGLRSTPSRSSSANVLPNPMGRRGSEQPSPLGRQVPASNSGGSTRDAALRGETSAPLWRSAIP